jgi:hypothetical protein
LTRVENQQAGGLYRKPIWNLATIHSVKWTSNQKNDAKIIIIQHMLVVDFMQLLHLKNLY